MQPERCWRKPVIWLLSDSSVLAAFFYGRVNIGCSYYFSWRSQYSRKWMRPPSGIFSISGVCILSTHVRMWRMLIRHRRTRVSESKQTTICENRGRRSLSLPDLYSFRPIIAIFYLCSSFDSVWAFVDSVLSIPFCFLVLRLFNGFLRMITAMKTNTANTARIGRLDMNHTRKSIEDIFNVFKLRLRPFWMRTGMVSGSVEVRTWTSWMER